MDSNFSFFSFGENFIFIKGCGHGVFQSHAVGELQCLSVGVDSVILINDNKKLSDLVDEKVNDIPSDPALTDVAIWLITMHGAILRDAGISTTHDFYVNSIPEIDANLKRCEIVFPVSSIHATKHVLKWLLVALNTSPDKINDISESYLELLSKIKKFSSQSLNHWRLLQAAHDEKYPVVSMFIPRISCIGTGIYRRLFDSFFTERTPYLGVRLAQDKHMTAQLLRSHGYPGAINILVKTRKQAQEAAKVIGYPLVVKPNDRDRGEGVAADLQSETDLNSSFDVARNLSQDVLIERHQSGFTHRFSVINGLVIRVAKHIAFGVIGDGKSSIESLLNARAQTLNAKKRNLKTGKDNYKLEEESIKLLEQYGYNLSYVPASLEYVRLRRKDNISAGGERVTLDLASVHPDNLKLAISVSELFCLDFAGIDLITQDVSRSWREGGVTICEINANPQLVALDDPGMYKRVLRRVMPAPFRVEATLLLIFDDLKETTLSKIIQQFSATLHGGGVSVKDGYWIQGDFVAGPFENGFMAATAMSANARVNKITAVMTLVEIKNHGLPLGEFDVVILPVTKDNHAKMLSKSSIYQKVFKMLVPHIQKITYLDHANDEI